MSKYYGQRRSTLQNLYDKIESICTRHIAVAEFDCGDVQSFGDDYKYPLVYLETITDVRENEKKNGESYSIALNILDRQPDDSDRAAMVQTHDKLKQMFSEIKAFMEQRSQFGDVNVGTASLLLFNDFNDAKLVRLRGEFTLDVDMVATDVPDLSLIFPE